MKRVKRFLLLLFVIGLAFALADEVGAVSIMIGDQDGFGFSSTAGLVTGWRTNTGGPADVDGDGIIEVGEFLPDLNKDGETSTNKGDDFDNRSLAESTDTSGAQWTDISLSTRSDPPLPNLPGSVNDAFFEFSFSVPSICDPDYGYDHFIEFVYADIDDYSPLYATVEGNTYTYLQTPVPPNDGLVELAHVEISW